MSELERCPGFDYVAHGLIPSPRRPLIPGDAPQTVADVLDRTLATRPDAEALVGRHARYTYASLDREVSRAAHALLELGIRPGDRIAGSMANHTELAVAFLGAMRIGAIWLGLNRTLAPPEKAYLLEDAGARLLIAEPGVIDEIDALEHAPAALRHRLIAAPGEASCPWAACVASAADETRPAIEIDPFAPAAIAYTSGTTGLPKGAVHSQHNILLPGAVDAHQGTNHARLRAGVCLPLTLLNLMILGPVACAQAGACCILMDRIDPKGIAEWVRTERIATFAAVPTMMHDLLTSPDVDPADLAPLTRPGVGGAGCPDEFKALFRARFGYDVRVSYGLTEAPTVVTDTVEGPTPTGGAGRDRPQLRVHILDEEGRMQPPGEVGEICVGPAEEGPFAGVYTPMLGYWNQPEVSATALAGGLLHTGDLGSRDEAGHLLVHDRRSDLILRGGANVYPAEVERVLHGDPRVAACAVLGVPDARLGERVVAAVRLVTGERATEAELQALCRQNVAWYKVPDRILLVDAFPTTPMGKIRKSEMVDWFDAT